MDALYIHIPFCDHICSYCDFAKEIAGKAKQKRYLRMLEREIRHHKGALDDVVSVFVGGGTPSLLDADDLKSLSKALSDAGVYALKDFTIEANPKDIDAEKAALFKTIGITRVSLGVQSFQKRHLDFLNRQHTKTTVFQAVDHLKNAGIDNINADMLFGIPTQTKAALRADLNTLLSLPFKHISYYSVIIEADTPLWHWIENGEVSPVDEALEGAMYDSVLRTLKAHGFNHYEISNFAKPGFSSLHNTMVWKSEDYLGVGAGAHSKWRGERFFNVRSIKKYSERMEAGESPVDSTYPLEPMRDYLLMGLRLTNGISLKAFETRFHTPLFTAYPDLLEDLENDLLTIENGQLHFTKRGMALGNTVFLKL